MRQLRDSPTLSRIAKTCLDRLVDPSNASLSQLAQEALAIAAVLRPDTEVGEAVTNIASFGLAQEQVKELASAAMRGEVAVPPPGVLGPRLAWQFDVLRPVDRDVPAINGRLALVAVLEQLC